MDLLRIESVKARTGLSRSDIYRRIKLNTTFPKPIRLEGSRVTVWPSTAIDTWIEEQVARAERERAPAE